MSEQPHSSSSKEAFASQAISPAAIGWGIAAFVFSIFVMFNSRDAVYAGFFTKTLAVILGSALGLAGALIGDLIRKLAKPDGFITSGGLYSLLWIKFFWALGPQCVGLFLGVIVGVGGILRYL